MASSREFSVPVICQDLSPEETHTQIQVALQSLECVSNQILERIMHRVEEETGKVLITLHSKVLSSVLIYWKASSVF
jgi:WAHD domain of WASH complex